jgi:hypothetical protein
MLPFFVVVLLAGLVQSKHPCAVEDEFHAMQLGSNQIVFAGTSAFTEAIHNCALHSLTKWVEYLQKSDGHDHNIVIASTYNLYWQALTTLNNVRSARYAELNSIAAKLEEFECLIDPNRQDCIAVNA